MNAPDKITKQELQIARSDLLDAFAELEEVIARLEARKNLKLNNASLGQRIARLRKLPDEKPPIRLPQLLDELAKLNELRTEIVHRQMNVAAVRGTAKALFIARQEGENFPPVARVISLEQFRIITAKIKSLGKQFSGFEV